MTAKDTARDLVVLKALAERVRAANEQAKRAALDDMDVSDRTTAKLADGTPVGSVTITRGRVVAKVTDAAKLLRWAREKAPTEVVTVTVEQIRPKYLEKLLETVKATGEVIPGIDIVEGEPYPAVKVADGAVEAIERAWADGSLPLPAAVLPELEGGR